jgi:crotonobetainyl-CoA:carnitine CoA-transferase CaiB-like acyl-CoA transferase
LPLAGLRVLEIGHYTTAPLAARHLANLGAEVVKIEPLEGEAVRGWPPAKNGTGYFFAFTNADKRTLVLNLETSEGTTVLKDLIARSDILIENLKPGALAKRGFSTEDMAHINPRLIYCAVSGFGADTIYGGRPAYDTVIQAMSGIMDLTRAGDVPVKSGISSADLMGAEMALVAILAAVEARDQTGLGQTIDMSMQDVGSWLTMTLWNGDESAPRPTVLRANDGFVVVEDGGPVGSQSAIAPKRAAELSREELVEVLRGAGLLAAPILSAAEMLASDQTRVRGLVFHAKDMAGEKWPLLASPLRLKGTPPVVRRLMGPLGSDGPAILAELASEPTMETAAAACATESIVRPPQQRRST